MLVKSVTAGFFLLNKLVSYYCVVLDSIGGILIGLNWSGIVVSLCFEFSGYFGLENTFFL